METIIFMDAVNVTPNVHNYVKNFKVGGRFSKNAKILHLKNLVLYGMNRATYLRDGTE